MGSLETATTQPGHTMGTKLSKATNTPPSDKSSTLPAPHNDEDESKVAVQSETLPRSGFGRTTGLGKSFRKSVRQRRENRRRTSRLLSRKPGLTSSRRCTLTTRRRWETRKRKRKRKRSPRLARQRPKRMRKRQSMSV